MGKFLFGSNKKVPCGFSQLTKILFLIWLFEKDLLYLLYKITNTKKSNMETTLTPKGLSYREQLNRLSLAVKKEIETIMLRHPSSSADFRELYESPSMEAYNSDCETFTVDEVVYDAEERSIDIYLSNYCDNIACTVRMDVRDNSGVPLTTLIDILHYLRECEDVLFEEEYE